MRLGLQIPSFSSVPAEQLAGWLKDVAQAADSGGYASLWVMDHFFQLGGWLGPAEDPMLEGYSAASYLAAVTQRARIGLMVTGVIYRYPAALVKTATTLDVLSGGRAYFGVGAAWYEHEAKSLGLPFPPLKERFELLEETLQLAHQMWRGDSSAFEGKYVQAAYPYSSPQPLSQPHPPILIGGMGERKTLRMVAQYADACNLFGRAEPDELRRKLDVLKQHCEALGRPYDEIEKTVLYTIDPAEMSTAEIIADLRRFADLGFTHVIHNVKGAYNADTIAQIAREVIPEAAGF
jgi:F420-dependent oxidoreductase-like protein